MIVRIQRYEVPVGFKWFAEGLSTGELCFGGEESAGASFLQRNGKVWTTDKDGIILGFLAAEITGLNGQDPWQHYQRLTQSHGTPCYQRNDSPMDDAQRAAFKQLMPEKVKAKTVAGEEIVRILTKASGNCVDWWHQGGNSSWLVRCEAFRDGSCVQVVRGEPECGRALATDR